MTTARPAEDFTVTQRYVAVATQGDHLVLADLRAIDRIAPEGVVGTVSIQGLGWGEVDYPSDLVTAEQLADRWVREGFGR